MPRDNNIIMHDKKKNSSDLTFVYMIFMSDLRKGVKRSNFDNFVLVISKPVLIIIQ